MRFQFCGPYWETSSRSFSSSAGRQWPRGQSLDSCTPPPSTAWRWSLLLQPATEPPPAPGNEFSDSSAALMQVESRSCCCLIIISFPMLLQSPPPCSSSISSSSSASSSSSLQQEENKQLWWSTCEAGARLQLPHCIIPSCAPAAAGDCILSARKAKASLIARMSEPALVPDAARCCS